MLALAKRKLCYSTDLFIERLLDAPETNNLLGIHILLDVWFAVVDTLLGAFWSAAPPGCRRATAHRCTQNTSSPVSRSLAAQCLDRPGLAT